VCVLWRHSNVNLVGSRQSHWPGREFPGVLPEINLGLAPPSPHRNHGNRSLPVAGRGKCQHL